MFACGCQTRRNAGSVKVDYNSKRASAVPVYINSYRRTAACQHWAEHFFSGCITTNVCLLPTEFAILAVQFLYRNGQWHKLGTGIVMVPFLLLSVMVPSLLRYLFQLREDGKHETLTLGSDNYILDDFPPATHDEEWQFIERKEKKLYETLQTQSQSIGWNPV